MIKKIIAYSLIDFLATKPEQDLCKEEKAALIHIDEEINNLISQADHIVFFGASIDSKEALTIKNAISKEDDESLSTLKVELSIGDDTKLASFFDTDCLITARLCRRNLIIEHTWRKEDFERVLS